MLLTPSPPVTNCHTYSDPLPVESDVLYGHEKPYPIFLKQSGHNNSVCDHSYDSNQDGDTPEGKRDGEIAFTRKRIRCL